MSIRKIIQNDILTQVISFIYLIKDISSIHYLQDK